MRTLNNTILVVGAAYVGTVMPPIVTGMALLAALSVGVLSLVFERINQGRAS